MKIISFNLEKRLQLAGTNGCDCSIYEIEKRIVRFDSAIVSTAR